MTKKIILGKVIWGGPGGCSMIWELDNRMKESYPELFLSGNFLGRKSFEVRKSCNISSLI